jgi:hypothetical protein
VWVAPRDDLVAVAEADAEGADGYDFVFYV